MQKLLSPNNILIFTIIIICGLGIYFYLPLFMPIIMALFTAMILEPFIRLLNKWLKLQNRFPSVVIVFLFFLCFIAGLGYLSATKLINEAIKFLHRLPYYVVEVNLFVEGLISNFNEVVDNLPPAVVNEIQRQGQIITKKAIVYGDEAIAQLVSFVQSVPHFVVLTLIYLITLFLISMDLPQLKESFYAHFREENAQKVRYMTRRLKAVFVGFFKAQFLVSVVIFIVSYIGLLIISPRNALLVSLIIWVIDFIPVIGSIVILGPWFVFSFITGDSSLGIKLMILAGILLAIRRTLEPKIMGDQIGLSPLATLISIYFGLYFFGVLGLFIGPLVIIMFKSATEAGIIKTDFKI